MRAILLVVTSVCMSAAMVAGCSRQSNGAELWELIYSKPTGPFANLEFEGVVDPAPDKAVNAFVVEIASRCGLQEWSVDYAEADDLNETATLRIPSLDAEQLSCIREVLRPPYLALRKVGA